MPRKRKFREDDLAVWRRVKSTVTPMNKDEMENLLERKMNEKSEQGSSRSVQKPAALPPPSVQLPKPAPLQDVSGLQKSTRRAIKRGGLEPTMRLDLHGMRLEPAKKKLLQFLNGAAHGGHKVVLIITGKGGHRRLSDFGHETSGVIRRAFPEWMHEAEFARIVSHFTPSHVKHGGEGAWYVFIRSDARRAAKQL